VHLVIPEVLVQQVERPMDPTVLQLILLTVMAERKQVVVHLMAVVEMELQVLSVRAVMDKMVQVVVVPMFLVGAAAAAVDTTAVPVVETVEVVPVVEVDLHML
jgi:hypothetical protein